MRLKDMVDGKRDVEAFDLISLKLCKLVKGENLTYKGIKAYKVYNDDEEVTFFINAHYRAQVINSKKLEKKE